MPVCCPVLCELSTCCFLFQSMQSSEQRKFCVLEFSGLRRNLLGVLQIQRRNTQESNFTVQYLIGGAGGEQPSAF